MTIVKKQFPDLDVKFVDLNIERPTDASSLERTALKMNCPQITFIDESALKSLPISGHEKLLVLTKAGSQGHWITLFPVSQFSSSYYFFDSYGQDFKNNFYDIQYYWPEHLRIVPLNNTDFQSDKTAVCGWYGLAVIYCWFVLSNKHLKNVLKLIPIDKRMLFEESTEQSRWYNDIILINFIEHAMTHSKEEVIQYFNIK